MLNTKSPVIFYLSLLLIPIGMYSKTWLPGNLTIMGGKEPFFIFGMGLIVVLMYLNINEFLNLRIRFKAFETKIILMLLSFIAISILFYNIQEVTKAMNIAFLVSYALLITVFFYLFPRFLFLNPEYFEKFMYIVAHFGFVFAIFGIFFYFSGITPIPKYSFGIVSFINHPNNTSIVFTTCLLPTIFIIYWKWNTLSVISKIYYILSVIAQLVAQLFTFTRAGLIACAVGMMIFFILYYRGKFLFILPFFVVSVPVFGAAFFQAKGFASFISRFYLLIPAYEMISQSTGRALWGYGVTNAMIEYKKKLTGMLPSEATINDPHNTYVTLILMTGIIFTFTLLFFTALLIYKATRKVFSSKNRFEVLFYIFSVSSLLSLLIQGLFDAELIKADFFTIQYLLIMLGLLYTSLALKKNVSILNKEKD